MFILRLPFKQKQSYSTSTYMYYPINCFYLHPEISSPPRYFFCFSSRLPQVSNIGFYIIVYLVYSAPFLSVPTLYFSSFLTYCEMYSTSFIFIVYFVILYSNSNLTFLTVLFVLSFISLVDYCVIVLNVIQFYCLPGYLAQNFGFDSRPGFSTNGSLP